jgi:arabinogalactan oligomer/maltooligosaccharide transport system permease protein
MAVDATRIEPGPLTTEPERGAGPTEAMAVGAGRAWWARYRLPYLYILPAAAVLAVITLYPIGYELYLSFTNFTTKSLRSGDADWVGLRNYERIFKNEIPLSDFNFWRILAFNFVWTIANVSLHVVLGVAVALLLNRRRIFFRKFFRPSSSSRGRCRRWSRRPSGRTCSTPVRRDQPLAGRARAPVRLQVAGADGRPDLLPADPAAGLLRGPDRERLAWLAVHDGGGLGALQSIPSDLYEAARIDGASRWRQFWDITAPLLRPAMVPAIMYGTILTFNQFNVIYFITSGGPLGKTEILVTQAFKLVNPAGLYGVAAAFSVLVFFVLLLLTLAQNKIVKGVEGYSNA